LNDGVLIDDCEVIESFLLFLQRFLTLLTLTRETILSPFSFEAARVTDSAENRLKSASGGAGLAGDTKVRSGAVGLEAKRPKGSGDSGMIGELPWRGRTAENDSFSSSCSCFRIVDPDVRTSLKSEEFLLVTWVFGAEPEMPLTTRRGGDGGECTDRVEVDSPLIDFEERGIGGYGASSGSRGIGVLLQQRTK
jgi:hypothetical protein